MNDISSGLNADFIAVILNESSFSCAGNEGAPGPDKSAKNLFARRKKMEPHTES
jgi:hypothetical protein